jgi:hypothetical protein
VIWKVVIRRTDKDLARAAAWYKQIGCKGKPPKYVELAGSRECLYGGNEIRPAEPLVLVEGALDKLAFTQAIGPRVACVATGSTGSSRSVYWVEQVRRARPVLVAFDVDENRAGETSAACWKDLVPLARRFRNALIWWQASRCVALPTSTSPGAKRSRPLPSGQRISRWKALHASVCHPG